MPPMPGRFPPSRADGSFSGNRHTPGAWVSPSPPSLPCFHSSFYLSVYSLPQGTIIRDHLPKSGQAGPEKGTSHQQQSLSKVEAAPVSPPAPAPQCPVACSGLL